LDAQTLYPRLLAAVMILLISFPVHEFSHALAAYRLGDGTARLFGRLTLNPIAHFDPVGGALLLISSLLGVGIGWAKPTPVNPANLQGGRYADAVVAFAGPASNLVLAAAAAIPLRFMEASTADVPVLVLNALAMFIVINIALMLFNLLPIPPLDGSAVLFAVMSPRASWQWRPVLQQYGLFILIAVAFIPLGPRGQTLFGFVFQSIGYPLFNLLVGRDFFFWR
jgi:Zn-dependent protease